MESVKQSGAPSRAWGGARPNGLATRLELDDDAIDQLISTGSKLLRDSPELQRFVAKGFTE